MKILTMKLIGTIILISTMLVKVNASIPLSGKIIESASESPLEYANIVVFSLPDSVFVTGTTSNEEGIFQLNNMNRGRYLLKISYIGFEEQLTQVDVSSNPIDLGEIRLDESNVLSEVIITSKISPFQSGVNGGIIANVSTTLLSGVGTASDVLQRMPGVVAENDKISVFGKGAPIIYINNRKVQDASELERIESSEISTVELLTNPGAKYDAEGRAVLLIKTKKRINGFSAQITERLRLGKYVGDTENVSLAYTKDELNLFATYYHNYRKRETTEDHYFTLENKEGVWKHNTLLPDYEYSNNSQQITAGFDYSLNDRHSVGGQYQFYTGDYKNTTPIYTFTDLNDERYETSQAQSFSKDDDYQHLVNAFYNGDFSNEFSLRFDFDYLKNHNKSKQQSNEIINNDETRIVDILNQTDYNLSAGKLTNSWKSEAGLVEFGAEYNYISGDGFVRSNGSTDNTEFTNKEQKTAGFASYSHTFGRVNVVTGLRYEFTSEQFTEGVEKREIIDRSYSDWYPNLSVSGALGDVNLNFSFNKRTRRPSFSQLNGNVVYINRFVFQRGDPYLKKSNIYDLNLQATLKTFNVSVGYAHTKNPVLLFLTEQENSDNSILSTYANFPKYRELYATFNWNTKIGFWQPNYSINVAQPFFSANYNGQMIDYDKFNYNLRAYNDFTLPARWVLSCNFMHSSDRQDAFFELTSYQCLDLGVRKSFLNNALRMNLMVYDVFNGVKLQNQMKINNLDWFSNQKFETRYASLSITYLFNNYSKRYRGSSAAQDDINRF